MRGLIFANGKINNLGALQSLLKTAAIVIAADGGGKHIERLGIKPHLIIGDLDSVSSKILKAYKRSGVLIQKYPQQKDDTDLEIAINAALQRGCKEIVICGGLGGRFDHSLGNLAVLRRMYPEKIRIWFDDGDVELFIIRDQSHIHGQVGDLVSLIPLSRRVLGVETNGLQYALNRETLFCSRARGISNVMTDEKATIIIHKGELLCVHTRSSREEGA